MPGKNLNDSHDNEQTNLILFKIQIGFEKTAKNKPLNLRLTDELGPVSGDLTSKVALRWQKGQLTRDSANREGESARKPLRRLTSFSSFVSKKIQESYLEMLKVLSKIN